jgi:hypothetical protein
LSTGTMQPYFYHVLQERLRSEDADMTILVPSDFTKTVMMKVAEYRDIPPPLERHIMISYVEHKWTYQTVPENSHKLGYNGKLLFLPFALAKHWVLVVMRLPQLKRGVGNANERSRVPAYLYDSLPTHFGDEQLHTLATATALIAERLLGLEWNLLGIPRDTNWINLMRKDSPEQEPGSNNCALHVLQTFGILATRARKIGQTIREVEGSQVVTRRSLMALIDSGAEKFNSER